MAVFKRIGLMGRFHSEQAKQTAERLLAFFKQNGIDVIVSENVADCLVEHSLTTMHIDELGAHCDLAVVIGGDGSMLGAARAVVQYGVPLLGINRGRLGFLTDIMPDDVEEKVGEVLAGDYISEPRFLVEMSVWRDGHEIGQGSAVNDVVLHPGRSAHMIEFELYIDGRFVYSQSSDGLIVSTPTGSTAYALSGGGPLMHPSLDAIGLVPLNPHTLSSRPIVVAGDSEIKLVIGDSNKEALSVTCDGQTNAVAKPGDEVIVRKKAETLTLIHPKDHSYYEACRSKLGWGQHLTNKVPRTTQKG